MSLCLLRARHRLRRLGHQGEAPSLPRRDQGHSQLRARWRADALRLRVRESRPTGGSADWPSPYGCPLPSRHPRPRVRADVARCRGSPIGGSPCLPPWGRGVEGAVARQESTLVASAFFLAIPLAETAAAAPTFFQSPSGNIGCVIDATGVRCDIREREWRPPPKPVSCSVDWGNGLDLGQTGRPRFTCAGDTVLGFGRTLSYGRSMRRRRFHCISRRSGVRCVNTRNDHGFALSRQHARRF
jgi:hypothetical protein